MKNKFLLEMRSRGYLNQCTDLDKLDNICNKQSITGYIGFDCTAPSLHVGSLMQIMCLRLLQNYVSGSFKSVSKRSQTRFQGLGSCQLLALFSGVHLVHTVHARFHPRFHALFQTRGLMAGFMGRL